MTFNRDAKLESILSDFRVAVRHCYHGRVCLVIEREYGCTTGHSTDTDELTSRDIDRVMRERPHKVIGHRGL